MTRLFLRRVEVTIGLGNEALIIDPTNFITFDIDRTASDTPATGKVEIYNLREDNETRVRRRGINLQLSAGYEGRFGLLFSGDITKVDREREGLDRKIVVTVGGAIEQRTRAIFSFSYAGTTPVKQIVKDIAKSFDGLTLGPLDLITDADVEEDYQYDGFASHALNGVLNPRGLRWYEDNGKIRIAKNQSAAPDRPSGVVVISEKTGMIGTPTLTDEGAKIETLIDHRLELEGVVEVQSEILNEGPNAVNPRALETIGNHKIIGLRHSGDNREGDFKTELNLRRFQ